MEYKSNEMSKAVKKAESDLDAMKKSIGSMDMNLQKNLSETQAREQQIKNLQVLPDINWLHN